MKLSRILLELRWQFSRWQPAPKPNRPARVRFAKALLQARKLIEDHPDVGAQFLAQDLGMKYELARRGLDYFIGSQSWGDRFGVDLDGLKAVMQAYAGHADLKGVLSHPKKYVEPSYLSAALQELHGR